MATHPRSGWTLMSGMPYFDEDLKRVVHPPAVDPQPEEFDDRAPPEGHLGLPVMRNGVTKEWSPPVEAEAPPPADLPLSRLAFRKLFSLAERVAIDNAVQGAMTDQKFATLKTLLKDFDASTEVHLGHQDIITGVGFLESVGLIAVGRGAEILAGDPPPS